MIPKKYVTWGSSGAVIRELAAYGAERAKVVGPENVYDFTIGSPSIEPPKKFFDVLDRLMKTVSPIELHTYAPAAGLESVRTAVAKYLSESFGLEYSPNDIYMTHGGILGGGAFHHIHINILALDLGAAHGQIVQPVFHDPFNAGIQIFKQAGVLLQIVQSIIQHKSVLL